MKKLISTLLLVLLLATCKKEPLFDEYGFYGESHAKLNGVAWTGKPGIFFTTVLCQPDSCIGIKIFQFNQKGEIRSDITINHIPIRPGRQTLNYGRHVSQKVHCSFSYGEYTSDGDVITGNYSIFEQNDDNYLDITELDLKTGDISGKFQGTVVRHEFWTPAGQQPDTIRITEGTFRGKIFRE